jgi:hypothetical protein
VDTAPLPRVAPGPAGDEPPETRRDRRDQPSPALRDRRDQPSPALRGGAVGRPNGGDEPIVVGPDGRLLRTVEAVARLLSGGLLVLGLALLVLQLVAPDLVPGTGFEAPTGPGWGRIAAHLAVGATGEAAAAARSRLPRAARGVLATAAIVAVFAVLWFAWWS